jgi:hypothetical protein
VKFSVVPPGTVLPPSPPKPESPRLKIRRGWISPSVYGPVRAVTTDGLWLFLRGEDGTWMGGHLPTCTEVKDGLKSPAACRSYVASGKAQADLERIRAGGGDGSG